MINEFGNRVVGIVDDVTKNSDLDNWRDQSSAYLNHLENHASDEAIIVSASDKIHNLLSTIEDYKIIGDKIWRRFSTKNRDDQIWWYQSILDVITRRNAPRQLTDQLSEMLNWLKSN